MPARMTLPRSAVEATTQSLSSRTKQEPNRNGRQGCHGRFIRTCYSRICVKMERTFISFHMMKMTMI
eukprot:scaffold2704_cov162-Skeletonema_menzelii.AAC.4